MSVALTRSRLSNALRCYFGYALSRLGSVRFLHITHYTLHHSPLFVSVEPANICQLKCPACPVGRHDVTRSNKDAVPNSQTMSNAVWQRTLSEVAKTAWVIQFYFQGEPLLNKDLPVMIREAHDAGLYTIVSTNAQAMTPELANALVAAGLDRIIVSMDGLSDASYNAYRIGGSLEKTKAALRYLRDAKQSQTKTKSQTFKQHQTIVELQCLRLKSNEHEWSELKRVYKSLGADKLTLKTAQLYDYANGHPLMPSNSKYSRYILGTDGLYHRRPLRKGCFRVWSGCVITTTGEVLPCCYDKAHTFSYGNIMTAPLKYLFCSPQAQAFRKAAYQQTPPICQECYK